MQAQERIGARREGAKAVLTGAAVGAVQGGVGGAVRGAGVAFVRSDAGRKAIATVAVLALFGVVLLVAGPVFLAQSSASAAGAFIQAGALEAAAAESGLDRDQVAVVMNASAAAGVPWPIVTAALTRSGTPPNGPTGLEEAARSAAGALSQAVAGIGAAPSGWQTSAGVLVDSDGRRYVDTEDQANVDAAARTRTNWVQALTDSGILGPHPGGAVPVVSTAPGGCPALGAGVEAGLQPDALALARCGAAEFDLAGVGGVGPRPIGTSDHPAGRAVDFMIPAYATPAGVAAGDAVAGWMIANAGAFGVTYVIWNERTWRPGTGWAPYTHPLDPGHANDTLSHRDHVHVSVHGNTGDATALVAPGEATAASASTAAGAVYDTALRWYLGTTAAPSGGVCDPTPGLNLTTHRADGATVTLGEAQLGVAATIAAVGTRLGVSTDGLILAVMTALQESGLRNLANAGEFSYPPGSRVMTEQAWAAARAGVIRSLALPNDGEGNDWDSVGVFQQRPSAGWGSVEEIMSVEYAAAAFFGGPGGPNSPSPRGLLDIPGWEVMPKGQAAQRVQVSAFPEAYAKWEPVAAAILGRVAGIACTGPTGAGPGGWVNPLPGAPITSPWNPSRLHPVLGVRMPHSGTDLQRPCGTPIVAAAQGTVVWSGGPAQGMTGHVIIVDHGGGIQTTYNHMYATGLAVGVGERVDAGQVIAQVGSDGNSTGCHLHFGVKVNGAFTNPEPFMAERGVILGAPL